MSEQYMHLLLDLGQLLTMSEQYLCLLLDLGQLLTVSEQYLRLLLDLGQLLTVSEQYLCLLLDLGQLLTVSEQYLCLLLPNHAPEVVGGVRHGALTRDVVEVRVTDVVADVAGVDVVTRPSRIIQHHTCSIV